MIQRGERPISISFHGLGGQGGGVLADWLVDLAEQNGFLAQATSVPGVAQRTGATVYYLELFPAAAADQRGAPPVMALMPMPGDVDLVIASELVEAGRAVTRGVVTPDRTTLIASSHRVFSISEKSAMGDGVLQTGKVVDACRKASKCFVAFDMQQIADDHGSVISAALFGAIAGSGALPFPRAAYEAAITRGGVGVNASLRAFAAAFEAARAGSAAEIAPAPQRALPIATGDIPDFIRAQFPDAIGAIVLEGARRCADYQDIDYARLYLNRLQPVLALDDGRQDYRLTRETARYLALWMSFEDTIRVADLKVRGARFDRFRAEVKADPGQIVYVVEFLHPRFQEICDTLPAALGRAMLQSPFWQKALRPLFKEGRYIHTAKLRGFFLMYLLSRLKRWRRGTLRYQVENAAIERWLADLRATTATHYDLALELAECPRLIKGYSDTHERGARNFQRIMAVLQRLTARPDGAAALARLRAAALKDEQGQALDDELRLIEA